MDYILNDEGQSIGWIMAVGWEYVATDLDGKQKASRDYFAAVAWLCQRWAICKRGAALE